MVLTSDLGEDVRDVAFNGAMAEDEQVGDLAVCLADLQKAQHFSFTLGEAIRIRLCFSVGHCCFSTAARALTLLGMSTHPGVAPAKVIRRRGQTVLSPRKVDVLRLVSAGASNPETAETLVIVGITMIYMIDAGIEKGE